MAEMKPRGAGHPLLEVKDLHRSFDVSRPWLNRVLEGAPRTLLHAVHGVSFTINRGETLSLASPNALMGSAMMRSTRQRGLRLA